MIEKALQARKLPDLLTMNNGEPVTAENWEQRRLELIDCLSKNLYGYTPPAPKSVRAEYTGCEKWLTFGGKAKCELYNICFDTPGGEFSFPISVIIPNHVQKPPVVVQLSFGLRYPVPVEEIIDNGFALVQMYYHEVEHDASLSAVWERNSSVAVSGRRPSAARWVCGLMLPAGLWTIFRPGMISIPSGLPLPDTPGWARRPCGAGRRIPVSSWHWAITPTTAVAA